MYNVDASKPPLLPATCVLMVSALVFGSAVVASLAGVRASLLPSALDHPSLRLAFILSLCSISCEAKLLVLIRRLVHDHCRHPQYCSNQILTRVLAPPH